MSTSCELLVERLGDLMSSELMGVAPDRRRACALRVAARAVELAAYEAARCGNPREAPPLILLANDLIRMTEPWADA